MNVVCRKGKFDAAHRVLDEYSQCFNLHGHEYHYELIFSYEKTLKIGYPIDFKDIKNIGCSWIDLNFDHCFIANPKDFILIEACKAIQSKIYFMHLIDSRGYCNPTAENIAKEIFFSLSFLLNDYHKTGLHLEIVRLQETMNCSVECTSITKKENTLLSDALTRSLIKFNKPFLKQLEENEVSKC